MATKSDNIHDVHLIDATAPKYLFKYQRINDNSLNGLRKGRLWASLPSTFNDPFEFKYSQVGVNPLTDEVDYLLDQISSFKVVCFTLDPLNILMWSHYASNHEGMCLGFLNKSVTTPVTYTMKFPKVDFNINTDLEKRKLVVSILGTKSPQWGYEKERRMFYVPEWPSEVGYPGELSMIFFGARTTKEDITRVKECILNQDIEYYRCKLSPSTYEIICTSLDE